MKKFTRDILINQLGATEEEVDLILEVQEILPFFAWNLEEGYNTRLLQSAFELKKDYATWIKEQIIRLNIKEDKYRKVWEHTNNKGNHFKVVADSPNIKMKEMVGNGYELNYYLSVEDCKKLCMVIGYAPRTNAKTKEISEKVRTYFILMEKFVKAKVEWDVVRGAEKGRHKKVMKAFDDYKKKYSHYFKENEDEGITAFPFLNDLINLMATGKLARELKMNKDDITRDNLNTEINERIDFIQNKLISLFGVGAPLGKILEQLFKEIEEEYGVNFKNEVIEKVRKHYDYVVRTNKEDK